MTTSDESAARQAQYWLRELQMEMPDIEWELQRLLAIKAAETMHADGGTDFVDLGSKLRSFTPEEYRGDPILALMVQKALRSHHIEHDGLSSLVSMYARALADKRTAPAPEMALVTYLIQQCGFDVKDPLPVPERIACTEDELILIERERILEICRVIMSILACGIRKTKMDNARETLPALCVSYAIDWDIEAVSTLLRACAYIGAGHTTGCQWARAWLLDQQQTDGRFGLLAPEAKKMGRGPSDWRLYFHPTVNAIWSLAEIRRPSLWVA